VTHIQRLILAVIAAVAAVLYGWAAGLDALEPYYEAAVRSMSTSWHNFFFGAFDPAGTVSLDKLPGAFWLQALAVRAFGFHTWVIVAPQVVEGVATVLVLYRAVSRLAGPVAGLTAAFLLAVSPATVALNRGNISDSLMILLLVLAADAVSSAIVDGRQTKLILAGLWVGIAFQAKMIEAWLVMPALGLAYLLDGPNRPGRRLRQLAVGAGVAAVVSVSWMIAVSVVPAAHRPYVDGSHHNSIFEQVFVYNGFGRFGQQTPLQLLAGQSLGIDPGIHAPAGPGRLFHGDLGRDIGWLLPLAVLAAGWGIVSRRRSGPPDPLRACFVLWGGWLVTLAVSFSFATTINAYYTAALTPAIAAVLGAAAAAVWSTRPAGAGYRIGLPVVVAGTGVYAIFLIPASGSHRPSWLVPVTIAVAAVAVGIQVASSVIRREVLFAAALAGGLAAATVAPAAASTELMAAHQGALDTPFEPTREADSIDATFINTPKRVALLIPGLEADQRGAPDLLAVQTAVIASTFINASGREALPIGGFTGTIPEPTLRQVQDDIQEGRFHLVVAGTSTDPRISWIAAHCLHLKSSDPKLHTYYCSPSAAR
jgi:4-amino-4-deoxy-L-arabinose transferase-like glycosyltransferase